MATESLRAVVCDDRQYTDCLCEKTVDYTAAKQKRKCRKGSIMYKVSRMVVEREKLGALTRVKSASGHTGTGCLCRVSRQCDASVIAAG